MEDNKHTQSKLRLNVHDIGDYYGDLEASYGIGERGIENIRTVAVCLKYDTPEENKANAERLQKCWNEYDTLVNKVVELKEDNVALRKDYEGVRVVSHDRKKKIETLVKERELLIEALNDILYSWNKRMSGDTEELKTTNINGDIIEFWSPIASLIDSEPIHKAKELLNNLQK